MAAWHFRCAIIPKIGILKYHKHIPIVRNRFTWCFSTLENRSLWAKARQRRTSLKLIHYTKPYSTTCTYAANSVPQIITASPEPTCDDGYAPIRKAVSAHSNIHNPKPWPNTAKTPSSPTNPITKKHRQSLSKSCAETFAKFPKIP